MAFAYRFLEQWELTKRLNVPDGEGQPRKGTLAKPGWGQLPAWDKEWKPEGSGGEGAQGCG